MTSTSGPDHRRAQAMMVLAALCWSTGGLLVRQLSFNDPWKVLFWRGIFLTLFIFGLLCWLHRQRVFAALRSIGPNETVSGSFVAATSICFLGSLSFTSVANTYVFMSLSPFFAALAARYFLGERVPAYTWAAMCVAAAGVVVVFVDSSGGRSLLGDALALCICCFFAGQVTILRKVRMSVDMLPQLLIAGCISIGVGFAMSSRLEIGPRDLALVAFMGCFQLGIGSALSTRASRHITAAELGLIALLEPVLGPFWVWLALGERPNAATLHGGVIVVLAVAGNQLLRYRATARVN